MRTGSFKASVNAGTVRRAIALCLALATLGVGDASTATTPETNSKLFQDGVTAYTTGNPVRARRLWARLAVKGHTLAQYNLGILYSTGKGVPREYDLAMKWFATAAKSGFGPAFVNLAIMHEYGLGTRKSPETALAYLTVASTALPPGRCRETAVRQRQAISAALPAKALLKATRLANASLRPTEQKHSFYSFQSECFSSIAVGGGTIGTIAQIAGFRPPAVAVPDRSVASDVATRAPVVRKPATKSLPVRQPAASPAQTEKPVTVARRSPAPSPTAVTGRWAYYAQLASVPSNDAAQRLEMKLRKRHAGTLGDQAMSIQEANLEKLGTVYRLRVGPFGEKAAAQDICRALKEKRQACYVVRRAKDAG